MLVIWSFKSYLYPYCLMKVWKWCLCVFYSFGKFSVNYVSLMDQVVFACPWNYFPETMPPFYSLLGFINMIISFLWKLREKHGSQFLQIYKWDLHHTRKHHNLVVKLLKQMAGYCFFYIVFIDLDKLWGYYV